jgi:hypothetical protein
MESGPDPIEFNDKMVGLQKEIGDKMAALGDKIGSSDTIVETEFLAELAAIKTLTDTNIAILDKLPTPKGGEDFKAAVKGIFGFYKEICDKEFTEMVKLLAKSDFGESDLVAVSALQQSLSDKETEWDKKVQDAQAAFAIKYNITIQ